MKANYSATNVSRLVAISLGIMLVYISDSVLGGLKQDYYKGIMICSFTCLVILYTIHLYKNVRRARGYYFDAIRIITSCAICLVGYYLQSKHLCEEVVVLGFMLVSYFMFFISMRTNYSRQPLGYSIYCGGFLQIFDKHPNDYVPPKLPIYDDWDDEGSNEETPESVKEKESNEVNGLTEELKDLNKQ